MPIDADELIKKYSLTAERISKVAGVSVKTAKKWLDRESPFPVPVVRLLLVVFGEVNPEYFKD